MKTGFYIDSKVMLGAKRVSALLLTCLMTALTACGGEANNQQGGMESINDKNLSFNGTLADASDAFAQTPSEASPEATPQAADTYNFEAAELPQPYAEYLEVLMQIMENGTDPNGRQYDYNEAWNFENNRFAIEDVDRDGRPELIFNFNESYMADMCEVVYEYDEDTVTLREELSAWVDTTYYSNGMVKELMSHNHGRDPEPRGIWPYMLSEYDPETDSYRLLYYVESWDGCINSEDFPNELDTDQDQLLYLITPGDEEVYAESEVMILNQEEYDNWVKEITPSWAEIHVAYRRMTKENIENIRTGYAQAAAYALQADDWFMGEEYGPSVGDYLLYDMDRDGSLELITSINQGTGRYSDNHFYGLAAGGKLTELPLVRLCDSVEKEWQADFDIGGNTQIDAYQDKDNIIFYEGNDYVREGIFGGYNETGFYYLKEGAVYQDSIRGSSEFFGNDGEDNEVHYYNMSDEEITEEQYEKIREDYVKDMEEIRVYQKWTYFSSEEISEGELSEETIRLRLFESFLGSV